MPAIRSMSCQRLLLGFDRGGDASPQCFLSSSIARFLSFRVVLLQQTKCRRSEGLARAEVLFCETLRLMSADRRRPSLKVEKEPQFDAWIGDCDFDLVAVGLVDRCRDIGVLVDIEHAPILVHRPERRAAPPSNGSSFPPLSVGGPVNERCGHAVEVVHDHAHAGPM